MAGHRKLLVSIGIAGAVEGTFQIYARRSRVQFLKSTCNATIVAPYQSYTKRIPVGEDATDLPGLKARSQRLNELARGLETELQRRRTDRRRLPMFTGEDYISGLTGAVEGPDKARRALERAVSHWEEMAWMIESG